jgi:hypothetical protein
LRIISENEERPSGLKGAFIVQTRASGELNSQVEDSRLHESDAAQEWTTCRRSELVAARVTSPRMLPGSQFSVNIESSLQWIHDATQRLDRILGML